MESKKTISASTSRPSGLSLERLTSYIRKTYSDRRSIAATAITFLLGLTPMTAGFDPFGVAFFFSSLLPTVPMAVGLFFSAAACGVTAPLPMICATLGALIKDHLSKKGKLNVATRILLSSFAGLIGGLFRMPFVADEIGEPIRTILLSLTVPLFCVIFLGLEQKNEVFGTAHEIVARMGIVFCLSRLASVVKLGRFSFGLIFSFALILYLTYLYTLYARVRPSPHVCISGCVIGFVCGLGLGDAASVSMLGIFGLVAGFLFPLHELTALICAPIGAMLFSIAANGAISGLLVFIHVTFAIGGYVVLRRIPRGEWVTHLFVREKAPKEKNRDEKLTLVEESFSSISKALSELQTIGSTEKTERFCPPLCCAGCNGCFSYGIDEYELQSRMRGFVKDNAEIPSHLLEKCPQSGLVLSSLELMQDRDTSVLNDTANRYEEFSRILSSMREANERESAVDTELSLRLSEALTKKGLYFSHSRVYGSRLLTAEVYDVDLKVMECSSNSLKATVSGVLERQVSDPFFQTHDDCVTMRFETVPACRVEHSMMTSAKQGEVTDGDTAAVFESGDGMIYGLINDGMGSGEAAAISSRMGAILIEKLVLLGSDKDEVLRLLNKLMLQKDDEVFTTVDLLSIDRLTMSAELLKAGAAQSYLIREGEIMVLSAKSTPLGLVESLAAKRLRFTLKHSDVIVMVSDGAHDGDGVPPWLDEYVNSGNDDSVAIMTAKLLERARECAEKPDDISVLVARIR